jgi:hypothetical protein
MGAAHDGLVEYPNASPGIGFLLSHDKSLAGPLSTVLGLEDMHDLIEVVLVDDYNDHVIRKRRRDQDQ